MRHPEILDALNGQSIATTPSSAPSLSHRPASPVHAAAPALRLQVRWARHLDEVRQAQRLRYQIFAEEMGAVLQTPVAGHDIDVFDDFCEHLMVCDEEQNKVIGTYRLLTPLRPSVPAVCTAIRSSISRPSTPGVRRWSSWGAAACMRSIARAA
jgi:N-acyl-L-homoserine lactone synthetase